jgi:hypothetical protein
MGGAPGSGGAVGSHPGRDTRGRGATRRCVPPMAPCAAEPESLDGTHVFVRPWPTAPRAPPGTPRQVGDTHLAIGDYPRNGVEAAPEFEPGIRSCRWRCCSRAEPPQGTSRTPPSAPASFGSRIQMATTGVLAEGYPTAGTAVAVRRSTCYPAPFAGADKGGGDAFSGIGPHYVREEPPR